MAIIYWLVFLIIFLYIVNLAFYRLKGVDLFQLPAQFPQSGKGLSNEKVIAENELIDVEKIWFDVADGKIESWFLADQQKRSTLIFAHGNSGFIDTNLKLAKAIQALGYHVLLVEYPGYGRSTGKPSEATITEGFCKAYDWLKNCANVGKIAAMGNSLGCSVVARLSRERPLDLLILKSGIASFAQLISRRAFIPQWLVVNGFNSIAYLRQFNQPVLILHGKSDPIAVYSNALAMKKAAQNSELVTFEGGHDSPSDSETLTQLKNFFASHDF